MQGQQQPVQRVFPDRHRGRGVVGVVLTGTCVLPDRHRGRVVVGEVMTGTRVLPDRHRGRGVVLTGTRVQGQW